jgi:hypothetical protein
MRPNEMLNNFLLNVPNSKRNPIPSSQQPGPFKLLRPAIVFILYISLPSFLESLPL